MGGCDSKESTGDASVMQYIHDTSIKQVKPSPDLVNKIWRDFDKNGDGQLDASECKNLKGTLLRAYSKELAAKRDILIKLVASPQTSAADKQQCSAVERQVSAAISTIEAAVRKNETDSGEEMRAKLDTDHNGRVTKDEFVNEWDRYVQGLIVG
eukprot:gnl/Spiro4/12260_TR6470_c0_g1_i1.p1 gnl/Spiro4/12260_TR6470_c0_g1~~gnl/Spiro4/12260_TR6470_c0_g1_i1.p1  ORF type:complete len:154 (-),score=49.36 gnl/Spiro4/12260_TR6470_c0_g1_i1:64-525(-)